MAGGTSLTFSGCVDMDKKKKVFKISLDMEADEKARELNPPKPKRRKRPVFDMQQALKVLGGLLAVGVLLWLAGWYEVFWPTPPKYTKNDDALQKAQMEAQHQERLLRQDERQQ